MNDLSRWLCGMLGVSLLWAVGGCSTTGGSDRSKADYVQTLEAAGVAPDTVARVENERVLRPKDIKAMVEKGISGSQIVAYLKSTRADYSMSQSQIQGLVAAGADSTLVNYLGRSQGDFLIDAQNSAAQNRLVENAQWEQEMWNNPYFTDPAFDGDVPFEFGWPAVW